VGHGEGATKELLPAFRLGIEKARIALDGYTDDQVMEAVRAIHDDKPVGQGPIRTAEYKQFTGAALEQPGDLPGIDDEFRAACADEGRSAERRGEAGGRAEAA
jgi:hypothetical protein